jgi:hypothetical protein
VCQRHDSGGAYRPRVRWDELFADLAGQGDADEAAQLATEVSDRGRWEAGQVSLADRVRGWPARRSVSVGLPAGDCAQGPLLAVGLDWLAVGDGREECVVPLPAVRWLRTDGPEQVSARAGSGRGSGPSVHRLRVAYVARSLVRDRAYVRIRLIEGETVSGTIDRAGPDHLELAQHPADLPRRTSAVQATWLLPYAAIASIRGGQVWSAS